MNMNKQKPEYVKRLQSLIYSGFFNMLRKYKLIFTK